MRAIFLRAMVFSAAGFWRAFPSTDRVDRVPAPCTGAFPAGAEAGLAVGAAVGGARALLQPAHRLLRLLRVRVDLVLVAADALPDVAAGGIFDRADHLPFWLGRARSGIEDHLLRAIVLGGRCAGAERQQGAGEHPCHWTTSRAARSG